MAERHYRRDHVASVVVGVVLVALGVSILLDRMEIYTWDLWTTWWPALIVLLGLVRLATVRCARDVGRGVTDLGIGAWLWLTVTHWHGLDWSTSWPMALVAVGAGMIARAIASPFFAKADGPEEEGSHVVHF